MSAHVFNSHTHTDTCTQHAQPTVELGAKAAPHTHTHTHINLFGFSVYKLYAAHVKNIVEVMSVSLSVCGRERGGKKRILFVLTLSKSNRNGEAAQSTILWAGKLRPPAARVQSTRSPWQRNNCMAETSEVP